MNAEAEAFIDSNVVLYLLSADRDKADRAEQVVAAGAVVSVQVFNEVTHVMRCKLRMPWQEVDEVLQSFALCLSGDLPFLKHASPVALATD